jgi:hypothetical protein
MGEFFQVLELEFSVKSFENFVQLITFSLQKDETLKMFYKRLLKLKEDTQNITTGSCPLVSSFVGRYSDTPCADFAMGFYKIWRLVHFVGCVQHF